MSGDLQYDVEAIREDFPIFIHSPHIYLDNAATTHKPTQVTEAITDFYEKHNANVHRGIYRIGAKATELYESARTTVADFIGASADEIVFTSGCTEGINQVAFGLISDRVNAQHNIVCLASEHHANLVPWQVMANRKGAELRIAHLDSRLDLDLDAISRLIDTHTALVAIAHTSNVTGARYPIEKVTAHAHKVGALVLIDAAQALLHEKIDVRALGADFVVFSGHKLLGPTGCGVLYGKAERLREMQPTRFGGDMIRRVEYDQTTFAAAPGKFEGGTPPIAAVIGMAAAIEYINRIGVKEIAEHTSKLTAAAEEIIRKEGFDILGNPTMRGPILSFSHSAIHPHDIASILDEQNIAVRAGHHCAQPFLKHIGLQATARASFSLYNTLAEIESLGEALRFAKKILL